MNRDAITNAFSVDVEEFFHASALSKATTPDKWPSLPSSVEECTETMLRLLDESGNKGTFFVLGIVAEERPDLVRKIAAAGHEIASHGYSHQLVYRQSRELFREETRRAKAILEHITGDPVVGYRAATFSITPRNPWAHDVLIECGFRYDSSVFPIRHDRYGDPSAPRFPYVIEHSDGAGSITEFPMSTTKLAGFRVPVSGGGYFRLLPQALNRFGLRRINQQERQPFIFYTHPWEIDDKQPRFDLGWLSNLRHYSNLGRCESWLRRLVSEFRFDTCANILQGMGFPLHGAPEQPRVERAAG